VCVLKKGILCSPRLHLILFDKKQQYCEILQFKLMVFYFNIL